MELSFTGTVFEWRGPAPYFYVAVPPDESDDIEAVKADFTYGWGVVPATCSVNGVEWTTSLVPRDGAFLVPLKDAVRREAEIDLGEEITVHLRLGRG